MGEQYKCGHCGGEKYRLFKDKDGIITECIQCKVKSLIQIDASLTVTWKDERGVMCTGWAKDENINQAG